MPTLNQVEAQPPTGPTLSHPDYPNHIQATAIPTPHQNTSHPKPLQHSLQNLLFQALTLLLTLPQLPLRLKKLRLPPNHRITLLLPAQLLHRAGAIRAHPLIHLISAQALGRPLAGQPAKRNPKVDVKRLFDVAAVVEALGVLVVFFVRVFVPVGSDAEAHAFYASDAAVGPARPEPDDGAQAEIAADCDA
jgi:hypothetical protein